MGSRVSRRDWQLMHVLAAWSIASFVLAIGFSTAYPEQVVNTAESIAALSPFWLVARTLVGLGAVAAIWLWLRMVGDYLRHRPSQFRIAWGITLFVGLFIGALFYFWQVWRPRTGQGVHAHAA